MTWIYICFLLIWEGSTFKQKINILSGEKKLFHLLECTSGPEVIKLISFPTQMSMFNTKITKHEIFFANKYENANNSWHCRIHQQRNFYAQLCLGGKNL